MRGKRQIWLVQRGAFDYSALENLGEVREIFSASTSPFNLGAIDDMLALIWPAVSATDQLALAGNAVLCALTLHRWL
jgi:hypothetical protein